MASNSSALGCNLDTDNNSNNNNLTMLKILYLISFNPYNKIAKQV